MYVTCGTPYCTSTMVVASSGPALACSSASSLETLTSLVISRLSPFTIRAFGIHLACVRNS